jgi:4a-hydroxytetrahydrobiopterin dehydratase
MTDLSEKKCVPCTAQTPPLTSDAAAALLLSVPGWEILESKKIIREFRFKDFAGALAFADRVGAIAEAEGHHPALLVTYGRLRVTLSTHAVGGLSENDFIMAAKINALQQGA